MEKLRWNFWVAVILIVIGLVFIFWGAHIYQTYPGMKELMKLARHAAKTQYIIGLVSIIGAWIMLGFYKRKRK